VAVEEDIVAALDAGLRCPTGRLQEQVVANAVDQVSARTPSFRIVELDMQFDVREAYRVRVRLSLCGFVWCCRIVLN
jgi:hypothetical protein